MESEKSETITGSIIELVPPFARIIRDFFRIGRSRAVEPVKGIEPKPDKRSDRPIILFKKKGDTMKAEVFLPPGGSVDFYL